MGKYITELNISQFRGINELEMKNIGDVNLLVGNNNVGKTSVLEAIKILSQPADVGNLVKTAVTDTVEQRILWIHFFLFFKKIA